MKKLRYILAALAFTFSGHAFSQTPVIWPFSPSSNQAAGLRTIIENANKSQKKYEFVFENKPGAGGTIATLALQRHQGTAVMMSSPSVFTRPLFYPNESYDIEGLEPIMVVTVDQPIVVLSKTIESFQELKNRKEATIGVNLGSITEIVARELQKQLPNTKLILVPYTGTIQATVDAVGGHVDMTVDFPKDTLQWVQEGSLKVIGSTGTKSYAPFKTFKSQGVDGLDNFVLNYYMVVKKGTSAEVIEELHKIFNDANKPSNVVDIWKADYATPVFKDLRSTKLFWDSQKEFWKKIKR